MLSTKIGTLIAKNNSNRLLKANTTDHSISDEVCSLTSASKSNINYPSEINVKALIAHYSNISTNPSYHMPVKKVHITK